MTVLEQLEDLLKQATTEHSHFYVAACCRRAIAEILRLRGGIECAANALTDSVLCSGNSVETNLHFIKKMRSFL